MALSDSRKIELAELAEFISNDYFNDYYIKPELIASANNISYNINDYNNHFDGILEYESNSFHIYLNSYNEYNLNTPRVRFSFAHELGHYFIDEHRNALLRGKSLLHKSIYDDEQKNDIEKEADYFAANLLMPNNKFQQKIYKRKFSYVLIDELLNTFGTSLPATLIRFTEIGNHPIMFVLSKKNIIKNYWYSDDFPYKYIQNYVTKKVPPLTVAGDYFNNNVECEDAEIVNANEWFSSHDNIRDVQLFEKCIYQKKWGTVISIIWEK